MDEVAPLVGDMLMEPAVFLEGLLIIPGAGLHPAQPLLKPGQFFLGLPQPVRRTGLFAVVSHVKVGHGIFQAYCGFLR